MIFPENTPPFQFLIVCVGALVLVSCAGGESYSVDVGSMAQRFLPTTREVNHHPDSLQDFSIVEKEDQYEVTLETGYESLHRKWSSTYQNMGTGRSRQTRSYATLWSKELSLAALEADVGFSSLTKERARELLQQRRDEYENVIEVDVYWFEREGSSLLAGPGSRVYLEIDDERYRPSDDSNGPLRETFLMGGDGRALYRRNTFRFPRTVDETDILADAKGVSLVVNLSGGARRVRFRWTWEDENQSEASHDRRLDRSPDGSILVGENERMNAP